MQPGESDSHVMANQGGERDDEGNPTTPGPTTPGINLELSTRDFPPTADSANSRLRATEQVPTTDQPRVQFTPANNYYKNVSENKDVTKLVALLATCINATKKVYHFVFLLIKSWSVFFLCRISQQHLMYFHDIIHYGNEIVMKN
jgi:hypothetical protein